MTNEVTTPANGTAAGDAPVAPTAVAPTAADKGKGKSAAPADEPMNDGDDDEEEEEEEDDEDDMEEEEDLHEIDPTAILPGARRTRGAKVDYTSQEALAKAGLTAEDDGDDAEESFVAPDDEMRDD